MSSLFTGTLRYAKISSPSFSAAAVKNSAAFFAKADLFGKEHNAQRHIFQRQEAGRRISNIHQRKIHGAPGA
jgi:hypothetical protein